MHFIVEQLPPTQKRLARIQDANRKGKVQKVTSNHLKQNSIMLNLTMPIKYLEYYYNNPNF